MEREEEKPKAFKIDDRRRFSSEGDLKPEFQGEEPPPAQDPQPVGAKAQAGATVPPSSDTMRGGVEPPAAHAIHLDDAHPHDHGEHAGHAHAGGQAAEMTFATFLVGLSTQALMLLGDIPDPQSGRPQQDLVGAQQLIDIIGMLELKTRGNLDREEAQLIEAILYELRMKYVERARTAR
jgi:uncharacterized protein DUF1844